MMRWFSANRAASNRSKAAGTPASLNSASASAAASSAALETPAATCGRATNAASPTIATRPTARHLLEQFLVHVGRKRAFRDHRAPSAVTNIFRRGLGQHLLAHGRADSVGADQQIGAHGFAIRELRRDGVCVLRGAHEPAA